MRIRVCEQVYILRFSRRLNDAPGGSSVIFSGGVTFVLHFEHNEEQMFQRICRRALDEGRLTFGYSTCVPFSL